MSRTTALGIVPNQRPVELGEFRNGWGWSPRIWDSLIRHHDLGERSVMNDAGLNRLWQMIEELPHWQQTPLVLTFDTGVIPFQMYGEAADELDEFDRRLPVPANHANHVPAMAALLRSRPEVPLFGVWGTSVSENPFDPWDEEADEPGSGIPIQPGTVYVLERHRPILWDTGLLRVSTISD